MGPQVQDEYVETLRATLAPSFRIEREIGRGGMATVYLAADLKHPRQVAIKVLKPELGVALGAERFLREIAIASRLNHPHIVQLYDSGAAGDVLYYVMPYIEGESLRQRLAREKQLPIDEAIRLTLDVADALDAAHAQGVIHRDIKPANILLEAGHALVADFGLARVIVQAAGESITSSGLIMGTPEYMSPEQAAGEELDARTDVYSLACVLYEMLAGEAPYTGPTAQTVAAKQMSQPVPSARVIRPTVSPALDAVIQRGLAKVPADRFRSAREFAEALAHPRAPVLPPRRKAIVAAALLLVAGCAAVFVLFGPLWHRGDAGGLGTGLGPPIVRVGVLPVSVQSAGAWSSRAQFIQHLFVSELTRYRGLAVEDPASLNSRLQRIASSAGVDLIRDVRRWGLQYVLRLAATPIPRGFEVTYALTDAKEGNVVESGTFADTDESSVPTQVREASGRLDVALETATGGLARGLDVAPFLTRAHNRAAVKAFLEGIAYTYRFLPGGSAHFRRAVQLDPSFVGPRVFLVSGLAASGDTVAARAQANVLENLKPQATSFERALIDWAGAVVRGDLDAKIRHLRVGLGYAPHNNILLYNLAWTLWLTGRLQEAIKPAREAMESGWRFAPLYTLWGKLAIDVGELSGLRDTLEIARSFAPPDPPLDAVLEALALFESDTAAAGRYAASLRAQVVDARLPATYSGLARTFRSLAQRAREQRRPRTAAMLLRRAVDAGGRQPILRLELARALDEGGNRTDAESCYREVAGSGVGGSDTLYTAGTVAELLGHVGDARRYFTRYLEGTAGGPDAARARERLRALGGPLGPP